MPAVQRLGNAALNSRTAPSRLIYPGSPGGVEILGSGPGYVSQSMIAGLGEHRFVTIGVPGITGARGSTQGAVVASTYGLPTKDGASSLIATSAAVSVFPGAAYPADGVAPLCMVPLDANRVLVVVYDNTVRGQSWVTVVDCSADTPVIAASSSALVRTGSIGPNSSFWYTEGEAGYDCLVALPDGNALYCTTVQVPYEGSPYYSYAAILPLAISGNIVTAGEWQIAASPLHVTDAFNIPNGGGGVIGTRAYFATYNASTTGTAHLSLIAYDYTTQSFVTDTGDTPIIDSVSVSANGSFSGFFAIEGTPGASYGQVFNGGYFSQTSIYAIDDTVVDGTKGPNVIAAFGGLAAVAPLENGQFLLLQPRVSMGVPSMASVLVTPGDMQKVPAVFFNDLVEGYPANLLTNFASMIPPCAITAEWDVVTSMMVGQSSSGPYYSYVDGNISNDMCFFTYVDYAPPSSGGRPGMAHGRFAQASKFDPRRPSFL